MIQVNKQASTQSVYFTSLESLDKTDVRMQFVNLTTDYVTTYPVRARATGDWYKCELNFPVTLPVGMYLVLVKDEIEDDVYARRLAYVSASRTKPIATDYDTYNSEPTNVVYEG